MKGKQTRFFVKDNRLIKLYTLNALHGCDFFEISYLTENKTFLFSASQMYLGMFVYSDTELNNILSLNLS